MGVKSGYKQTEVGEIPTSWSMRRLDELLQCSRPIRYGIVQPGKYDPTGNFMLRSQDYSKGWAGPDGMHRISAQLENQFRNARVRSSDFVITVVGAGIGQIAIIPEWLDGAILSRSTARIAVDEAKAARGFVRAFLEGPLGKRQILDYQKEGAQPVVSCVDLGKFYVATPPLPEQRAIATTLSDVDGLLDGLDRLIAKKRDLKQAAMQQLLTGQTRLPGFKGEWKTIKFGALCEYVEGVPTLGGDIGYLEIGDVDVETKSYDVAQKEKLSVRGSVLVPADTLLISTVRPTRGAIVITKTALHVSSAFCRVRPMNGLLFHLMCQPRFLAYLGENSIGGTYPTCRDETILGYESVLPSDPAEQAAIAEVLADMDAELTALEQRRAKTRALKQAMMQALLTGRVRLVTPTATP